MGNTIVEVRDDVTMVSIPRPPHLNRAFHLSLTLHYSEIHSKTCRSSLASPSYNLRLKTFSWTRLVQSNTRCYHHPLMHQLKWTNPVAERFGKRLSRVDFPLQCRNGKYLRNSDSSMSEPCQLQCTHSLCYRHKKCKYALPKS